MKTLDRYILRELLRPTLFGLFIFGSLWMVNLLIGTIHLFVSKGVAFSAVVLIFVYSTPTIVVTAAPMACLLGALLAMGRLNADSEIIAAKGCGIGYLRMMIPVFFAGAAISVVVFLFNEQVVPEANARRQQVFTDEVVLKKPLPKIARNVFFDGGSFRVFVRRYDPEAEVMERVTCYQFEKEGYPVVTEAKEAKMEEGRWIFRDGVTYAYRPDGSVERKIRFETWVYPFSIRHAERLGSSGPKAPKEMTLRELFVHIKEKRARGLTTRGLEVDLWFKTAFPCASFFLVLVGTPLAASNRRGGGGGVGLSILLMFVYYVLLATGKALGDGGTIPPLVGAWAPNVAMLMLAAVLLRRATR